MARSKSEIVVALQNVGKTFLAEQGITQGLTVAQHANIVSRFVAQAQPEPEELWLALRYTKGALNTSAFRQYFESEGILDKKSAAESEYVG